MPQNSSRVKKDKQDTALLKILTGNGHLQWGILKWYKDNNFKTNKPD